MLLAVAVWDDASYCTLDELSETLKRRADDYVLVELPEDLHEDHYDIYIKGYVHGYYT